MVVALMTTVCANAQQMFVKPMVGGTLSTVTKVDDAKMKLGLVGGAEFGYQLNDQFAVTAGLLAAMEGSGMKDGEQTKDVKSTTTYLNVPILANYYVLPGLAIKAGIQPGFLLSAKHKGSLSSNPSSSKSFSLAEGYYFNLQNFSFKLQALSPSPEATTSIFLILTSSFNNPKRYVYER